MRRVGMCKNLVCTHHNKGRYQNVGFKNRKKRMIQGTSSPKVANVISVTDLRKGNPLTFSDQ